MVEHAVRRQGRSLAEVLVCLTLASLFVPSSASGKLGEPTPPQRARAATTAALPTQPVWMKLADGPARSVHQIVYDAARDVFVLFGGGLEGRKQLETWEFDGRRWQLVSAEGPAARWRQAMAYDPERECVVLYGGTDVDGDYLYDTWEYDAGGWKQVAEDGPQLDGNEMVWDGARGAMVMWGHVSPHNTIRPGETWEFDGERAQWRRLSEEGPPNIEGVGLVYDRRRRVVVWFGGQTPGGYLGETWEFDGKGWQMKSSTGPSPRSQPLMTFQEERGVVVLFGGFRGSPAAIEPLSDTWFWDGRQWRQGPTSGPPPRGVGGIAYDSRRGMVVIHGGQHGDGQRSDTWALSSPAGDLLVADGHDYDGDGNPAPAVYDPETKRWSTDSGASPRFGASGAVPVPGDYDGDGMTDLAYFRPAGGLWNVKGVLRAKGFGQPDDIPAPADYDGDGRTDPAFFRPGDATWHVSRVADGRLTEVETLAIGAHGDLVVPGDYDGDGRAEPALFRPTTAQWFLGEADPVVFGSVGSIPVAADYDGDGRTDLAVWSPQTRKWSIRDLATAKHGVWGQVAVPGDFDGDGDADVATYDPATGTWQVRKGLKLQRGGPGMLPLVR